MYVVSEMNCKLYRLDCLWFIGPLPSRIEVDVIICMGNEIVRAKGSDISPSIERVGSGVRYVNDRLVSASIHAVDSMVDATSFFIVG